MAELKTIKSIRDDYERDLEKEHPDMKGNIYAKYGYVTARLVADLVKAREELKAFRNGDRTK